ncbi:MAG: hypothetical protein ACJ8AO_18765 [Gemmatimonadaceae bacterium]
MIQHEIPRRLAAALCGAAVAALAACADAPTAAPAAPALAAVAANATANDVAMPVHMPIRVPCSRVGWEIVPLTGTEHGSYQLVVTPAGDARERFHVNAHDVTGTGLVTGDLYRASGTTEETFEWNLTSSPPYSHEITYGFNVQNLTWPGSAGSIHVTEVVRVDVDAEWNVTATVTKFDAECRS